MPPLIPNQAPVVADAQAVRWFDMNIICRFVLGYVLFVNGSSIIRQLFFFNCKSHLILYSTVLYCTLLYSTVLYCTLLYSTVLYCTLLYCSALYCIVLYCSVLYCTVLLYLISFHTCPMLSCHVISLVTGLLLIKPTTNDSWLFRHCDLLLVRHWHWKVRI